MTQSTLERKLITWPLTVLCPPLGKMTIFMKTVAFKIKRYSNVFSPMNTEGTSGTFILLNYDPAGIFLLSIALLHLFHNQTLSILS